jgi:hypothetical protein
MWGKTGAQIITTKQQQQQQEVLFLECGQGKQTAVGCKTFQKEKKRNN